jgi:hypothetical protein
MDPNFCTEFYDDEFEEKCDEWADKEVCDEWTDSFFENDHLEQDPLQSVQLNADQMGLAMAFGEFASIQERTYDIDEDTDKENWENAMSLCSLQDRHSPANGQKLAEFEQYINNITSGKCNGPWNKKV